MPWTLTDDLDAYLSEADEFLRSRPVQHTIQLTATQTLLARGSAAFSQVKPLFGWWWQAQDDAVRCALLHIPPYPVLLTPLPAGAAEPLAARLHAMGRQLAGVNAEQGDAAAFAAAWAGQTGATASVFRRSRLFRLGELVPPDPFPAGAARLATQADRALLESWLVAFHEELHDMAGHLPDTTDDHLSYGGFTFWEAGGGPVSLAGYKRPEAGVVRIGPVYTPPELRRHGYAGAATVAVSQAALDAGAAAVVLFTDLANPTSNALYQRLGYRHVEDRVVLSFGG